MKNTRQDDIFLINANKSFFKSAHNINFIFILCITKIELTSTGTITHVVLYC